jgi:hypothetical protein
MFSSRAGSWGSRCPLFNKSIFLFHFFKSFGHMQEKNTRILRGRDAGGKKTGPRPLAAAAVRGHHA